MAETHGTSSADFPGVAFEDAVLRVVLSCGGEFDNEADRQAALHHAILAMHPDDVDRTDRGPGKIIADLEQFAEAERFAHLFAAAPGQNQALRRMVDAIEEMLDAEDLQITGDCGDLLLQIAQIGNRAIRKAAGESA